MMGFLIFLLVVWLIFSVVGFVVEGLLWLAVIGIVLFVATAIFGWVRRTASRR